MCSMIGDVTVQGQRNSSVFVASQWTPDEVTVTFPYAEVLPTTRVGGVNTGRVGWYVCAVVCTQDLKQVTNSVWMHHRYHVLYSAVTPWNTYVNVSSFVLVESEAPPIAAIAIPSTWPTCAPLLLDGTGSVVPEGRTAVYTWTLQPVTAADAANATLVALLDSALQEATAEAINATGPGGAVSVTLPTWGLVGGVSYKVQLHMVTSAGEVATVMAMY